MPPNARQLLGRRGEAAAAVHLKANGYRLIERNYRCAAGEMDLIAEKDGELVFVEVRTRSGRALGTPEESITPAKARRLADVASTYIQDERPETEAWRIDVVAIELDHRGRIARLTHIPYAIEVPS